MQYDPGSNVSQKSELQSTVCNIMILGPKSAKPYSNKSELESVTCNIMILGPMSAKPHSPTNQELEPAMCNIIILGPVSAKPHSTTERCAPSFQPCPFPYQHQPNHHESGLVNCISIKTIVICFIWLQLPPLVSNDQALLLILKVLFRNSDSESTSLSLSYTLSCEEKHGGHSSGFWSRLECVNGQHPPSKTPVGVLPWTCQSEGKWPSRYTSGYGTLTNGLLLRGSEMLRSLWAQSQRHHTTDHVRGLERRSMRRTIFLERMREGHCQSDEHWNHFKGNTGETSERQSGAHMGFSKFIDTILNWSEILEKNVNGDVVIGTGITGSPICHACVNQKIQDMPLLLQPPASGAAALSWHGTDAAAAQSFRYGIAPSGKHCQHVALLLLCTHKHVGTVSDETDANLNSEDAVIFSEAVTMRDRVDGGPNVQVAWTVKIASS